MKHHIFLTFALFLFCSLSAQENFKKGYFVDRDNHKTECLIDFKLLQDDQSTITYKNGEKELPSTVSTDQYKEIKIENSDNYYRRFTYQMDGSDEYGKEELYNEENLLKVLFEGEYSLYERKNGKNSVFFYQKDNGPLKQLKVKSRKEGTSIITSYLFREELSNNLICSASGIDFSKIFYYEADLVDTFKRYHKCKQLDYEDYFARRQRSKISFGASAEAVLPFSPGSTITTQNNYFILQGEDAGKYIENYVGTPKVNYGFSIGFEVESRLPLFKYRLALFSNPRFKSINYSIASLKLESYENSSKPVKDKELVNVKTNNINLMEIPVGVRYYFSSQNAAKMHLGFAYHFNYNFNKDLLEVDYQSDYEGNIKPISLKAKGSLSMQVGYRMNEKYNFIFTYYPTNIFMLPENKYNVENEMKLNNMATLNFIYYFN